MTTRVPLSAAQEGIWRGQLLDSSSTSYVTAEYLELPASVELELLASAAALAVREAEGVHARIVVVDGATWQELPDEVSSAPPVREFRTWTEAEAWMRDDLSVPFDLTAGPMLRHALLRIGRETVVWYVAAHHLALDGYAYSLLFARGAEVYGAMAARRSVAPGRFPPLARVVAEDAAYGGSSAVEGDRTYFHARLAGLVEPCSLALTQADAPQRPRRVQRALDGDLRRSLDVFARARGPSWVHALTALFASFLEQRTQRGEVVLGLPVLARLGGEALRAPTMMMNIAPLRLAPGARTWGEGAEAVKRELGALLPHARYRHERLRRELGFLGGSRRLFGPVFNVLPFPRVHRFGPLSAKVCALSAGPVEDLSVSIYPVGEGVEVVFDGHPELYGARALERAADEFVEHVRRHAAHAQRPLVYVAAAGEVTQHGGALAAPARDVVAALYARAREDGARVAVQDGALELSYAGLLHRAQALAELLLAYGIEEGQRIALALPRGVDAVVAMLAALVAKATYLPIDPAGAPARNERILAEARPRLVITREWLDGQRPALDERHAEVARRWAGGGGLEYDGADAALAAYVIYTSGSTGVPKGVVVSRGALAHFSAAAQERYALERHDRVLQFAPLAFDAAVEEIFVTLGAGATLVIRPPDMTDSIARFVAHARELAVTVLDLPTSFFHELAFALAHGAPWPACVRSVIIGGEAALRERVEAFLRATGGVRLFNTYGPTEATVVATCAELTRERAGGADEALPIGRPLAGVSAILRPTHVASEYELWLAGPALADGYLGDPALTARSFVELDGHGRGYRTGDLVRLLSDGSLSFSGRQDAQLKIRGHRVELEEVERALAAHPAVREAVVVVGGSQADPKLIAHLVLAEGPYGSLHDVREHCRGTLLSAAVPADFVSHPALPKTDTGKLDRARLVAHRRHASELPDEPLSDVERVIREVFCEVLQRDDVPLEGDFFELGGQSLESVQAATRLSLRLSREVAGALIFRHPTVRTLARALVGDAPDPHEGGVRELVESDATLAGELALPARELGTAVLLTGATGFLGVHLLRELLRRGEGEVICLVRADDDAEAWMRLCAAWERESGGQELPRGRVRALAADLSRPRLGVREDVLKALERACRHVVHNGASVSLARKYTSLRAVNVAATRELIQLASAMGRGTFSYVSSIATAHSEQGIAERFVAYHEGLRDGYSQSKWASERLLEQAAERGLTVRVFRLGRLIGPLASARINRDDLVWRIITAGVRIGALPLLAVSEPWSPVDVVARAMVQTVERDDDQETGVFNLVPRAGVRLDAVMRWVAEAGYRVTLCSPQEFSVRLQRRASQVDASTVAMLSALAELPPPRHAVIANERAERLMSRASLRFPAIDPDLLRRYLAGGARQGVLPPPELPAGPAEVPHVPE